MKRYAAALLPAPSAALMLPASSQLLAISLLSPSSRFPAARGPRRPARRRTYCSSSIGLMPFRSVSRFPARIGQNAARKRFQSSSSTPPPPDDAGASNTHKDKSSSSQNPSWFARMRDSWRKTPVRWTPLPIAGGIALLVVLDLWKQSGMSSSLHSPDFRDGTYDSAKDNAPTVKGPWQVHVIGALPLRTISRIYGALNSYTLPVWFRVPGYKLYSWVFGVNLEECDPQDLRAYTSLSDFFLRRLKPGVRPIHDEYLLVSPADGRVVNFGYIENRRVEQVKGVSYSLDALLSGTGQASSIATNVTAAPSSDTNNGNADSENARVDDQEFANLNGLSYTVDQLMGQEPHRNQPTQPAAKIQPTEPEHDASVDSDTSSGNNISDPPATSASQHSLAEEISIASQTFDPASPHWTLRGVPKEGNKMFFCVVYLAPGDYHRFHSPTNWVVERRRHFAGELFSVSPYMSRLLADLFVLNERVALLGRWRYGFFGYVPVGATNVGSIRINFDADLRTNSPTRPKVPGEFAEATYAKSSALLQGKPCVIGEEMGGFMLGSTIVLVFEAPEDFMFAVRRGDKVKVGEPLADRKEKIAQLLQQNKAKEMLNA